MTTLRLTQLGAPSNGRFPVEITLEGAGLRRTASVQAAFNLPAADSAGIRWYLEDYLERSADPAPRIAAGIEQRMAEIGRDLFRALFEGNRDAIRLWNDAVDRLGDTRVEVSTGIREAHAVPWELLRDPRTDAPLALVAQEFVRVQSQTGRAPVIPAPVESGPVRLLMVICRPSGAEDVPFRSVASRLVKALTQVGTKAVDLYVLRPPSFEELARVLRRAKAEGRPFHVVHFDGHGMYVGDARRAEIERHESFDPLRSGPAETGKARGYVCFEDATRPSHMRLVDGATLGNLLYESTVPTLVLNACRSALGMPALEDESADTGSPTAHEDHVRAYGSFAQAVVDAGVAGVIAMRYNVLVVTAAQFVGEFYQALAEGHTLGQAATLARKHLGDVRLRAAGGKRIELQDWPVPAVYEATQIRLFRRREIAALFDKIDWTPPVSAIGELPRAPDIGFIGRDETLLALDRGFDRQAAVLLHGLAGSGKTTTAAEFARWYGTTGGVSGPLLFDSFEQYRPLPRLLDRIGALFRPKLEPQGIHWLALDESERRRLALTLLSIQPVFWIWDNVEPVAGFPVGALSPWTASEQQELADFLRDLGQTKAKVLLTSRRDESAWLGDAAARVRIPPMPRLERMDFAEALLARHGGEPRLVEAMEPLLDFSRGNPLTMGVVLRQAMQEHIRSREAAATLAARLRSGEAAFDDDEEEGRSRSLGASLSYGFSHGFDAAERRRLALLHLFQGTVWDLILAHMEHRLLGGGQPAPEEWRALLSRAADCGLLTRDGAGIFTVHPALSWFFRDLFKRTYPDEAPGTEPSPAMRAEHSFAIEVLDATAATEDAVNVTPALRAVLRSQEANLLHVRRLAERYGWWDEALEATRCLSNLYIVEARRSEFCRIQRSLCDQLLDSSTLYPLPGREEYWLKILKVAHNLAYYDYRPEYGRRIVTILSAKLQQELGDINNINAGTLTPEQFLLAQTYLHCVRITVGNVTNRKAVAEIPEAADLAEQAYKLAKTLDLKREAFGNALHLGHCYMDLGFAKEPGNKEVEFATAEYWYEIALKEPGHDNGRNRLMCLYELAQVRYARFQDAMLTGAAPEILQKRINDALSAVHFIRDHTHGDLVENIMQIHLLLGNILDDAAMLNSDAGLFAEAGTSYQTALQIADKSDDYLAASLACRAMARSKARQFEFQDSVIYAEEASRRALLAGPSGEQALALSKKLVSDIRKMRETGRKGIL